MRESLLRRLLTPFVEVRNGESTTAVLMFAYSFLAMTAYNIIKPITRSKFITDLGADNLPYIQLAAGLLIGLVMQLYSLLVRVLPRRWAIPCTEAGMGGLLVAFWFLFGTERAWASVLFYLFGLILGILLISQFWTLANDIYDPRQAKRLFGFIGGGASLGGMTGAALTALIVDRVGTENLLLVSAAVLGSCMVVVSGVTRKAKFPGAAMGTAVRDERGVGGAQAVRLLQDSRHLQIIALVIGFAAIGAGIIEQQLNMAAEAFKGPDATDAITGFLAQITLYLSAVGFIIQVGLTSRVHRLLGIGFALLVLPVGLGATGLIMLFNAALWAPALARILDTSLRYTLDKTTREILFLPLPTELKYQAKPFVDVTIDRVAKGVGAVLLLILIKGMQFTWQQLSYASLVVTGLWIATAIRARREYLASFRRSLERQEIPAAHLRLGIADLSTVETLVQALAHPDERRVLYAIDLLESLDKRQLITPLLLHHESAKVRARALIALESAPDDISQHWLAAVERMLGDPSAAVRAAAVRALSAIRKADAVELMRPYLKDRDARVCVTAAVALAHSQRPEDLDAAEGALRRLVFDLRDSAATARREVAAAIGPVEQPRFRQLLIPLMEDPDVDVALEAIQSVRQHGGRDPVFVPILISLLGHRLLKRAARDALVAYGEEIADSLTTVLRNPDADVWVRRHIPATLARISSRKSLDVLIDALGTPDGFLRYKVVEALERLRREHPELGVDHHPIEERLLKESLSYFRYLSLRDSLTRNDGVGKDSLLCRALSEKLHRTCDRIYRLLGVIYPWKDVAAARWSIEHDEGWLRASAIEYLDNVLPGPLRTRLIPIFDDTPVEEKVRKGHVVLKMEARSAEQSLALLIRDEDPVVVASAIHLVGDRKISVLTLDVEYAPTHRNEPHIIDAASWALTLCQNAEAEAQKRLPAVAVVARLRHIPLFGHVSIDELFRIAETGAQVDYEPGRTLYHEGHAHDVLHFLLDGSVILTESGRPAATVAPPAALAFEEVVEPCPMRYTARTAGPTRCLVLSANQFFALLAENPELTQGLLRMLLDNPVLSGWRTVLKSEAAAEIARHRPHELTPLDVVRLLQEIPLFSRAGTGQLFEVAKRVQQIPFAAGSRVFSEGDPSAICMLLSGKVSLERPEHSTCIVAEPGDAMGIYETLVGISAGCRGQVIEPGVALRLDREDLFDVLTTHVGLLRDLFNVICTAPLVEATAHA